jgi:hypothetical protein
MVESTPAKQPALSPAGFVLNIDGRNFRFSELRQVDSQIEIVEYMQSEARTGALPTRLPGKRLPPTVVLTRPMSADQSLATWHQQTVTTGTGGVASCRLDILSREGTPVASFTLESAMPTRLEIRPAQDRSILAETLTLTCDAVTRVAP